MKNYEKFLCLVLSLSLSLFVFPIGLGAQSPSLDWEQTESPTPGGTATLVLRLPLSEIAGGFISVDYDPALMTLDTVTLADGLEDLTLSYAGNDGKLNILLDAVQNVQIADALLALSFTTAEEIAPGTYPITFSVPDAASFYALAEDGTAIPLAMGGCVANVTVTDPPLPFAPVHYLACQDAEVRDGTFSVRICAATDTPDALSHYGFICLITDAEGTRELTFAGSEMTDAIDGGGQTYTAAQLGYAAIYSAALTLNAASEVRIAVTPYAKMGDQTLYGGTYTVIYRDSCYIKTEY